MEDYYFIPEPTSILKHQLFCSVCRPGCHESVNTSNDILEESSQRDEYSERKSLKPYLSSFMKN